MKLHSSNDAVWLSNPESILRCAVRRVLCLLALLAALTMLSLLTGCGGGGDEDEAPAQFIGPPDCRARPELCQ